MPIPKASPAIYQLKVTLIGIDPPIWRMLQVLSSIKLCCLHSAIQVAMGWTDSHLHQFEQDGKHWGAVQLYEDEANDVVDDGSVTLASLLKSEGDSLAYQYDFGDDWQHAVVLEKVMPVQEESKVPICLGGERRCPPEDVGGIHGYLAFLDIILDPKHQDYEEYVGWAGGHFVDGFDAKAANTKLAGMRWPVRHRW